MTDSLNNLLLEIEILIAQLKEKNKNELRYRIGEQLSVFYIKEKKSIKDLFSWTLIVINRFYKKHNLDVRLLNSDKYKNLTTWYKLLTAISDYLNKKYGEEGYGLANLNYMQQFYKKYRGAPDLYEKALQLDWSHNIALLKDKISEDERKYYLQKAIDESWSVKELEKQIKEESYDDFIETIEHSNYQYNIDKLTIKNYKSLVDVEISNPSKFLVFAGANATGKSNIFEAIEMLMHSAMVTGSFVFDIFGGKEKVINFNALQNKESILEVSLDLFFQFSQDLQRTKFGFKYDIYNKRLSKEFTNISKLDERLVQSFSRVFIDNYKRAENKIKVHNKIWLDAANLSNILKTVLENKAKSEEIIEWLQILIPEIDKVTIEKDFSGKEEIRVYEKSYPKKAFTGSLISEGTYNIIALLVLFYQTDYPQFVCIEEPETGLNPAILSELVPFFREMTDKYNHHIWITTHSTSLVAELVERELIIVSKKEGRTLINQCQEGDFEEMKPDEAWMSKMLKGGGLPW
ncbi:MAG: AAA family ATPase [Bacteroidales bacterium]|nr:AAA family ATPase [Bacteroidales bacterium]MCF8457200.1 AAA family ATPase [Bacteroidales bacterium]